MADINECPNDNENCLKEECRFYDEYENFECSLKKCDNCLHYNDGSGNCSLDGTWSYRDSWCSDGDFYNPYQRLI